MELQTEERKGLSMERIDVFAHVLPKVFYQKLLDIEPYIPRRYPYFASAVLTDMEVRRSYWDHETKQVISCVNALPEDFADPERAAELCWEGNEQLMALKRNNADMFEAAVLMVPMNNMEEAIRIIREQVLPNDDAVGIQVFTRALGKSIADPDFLPLFEALNDYRVSCWLHPVFDSRKPDNNIVFSWEYELTQAMYQMVEARLFREFSFLKVLCHHAGGMVPFFQGRVANILPGKLAADLRRFYVDTAILGNTKGLELALDYYGTDHVLFGTDAPFGVPPAGATEQVVQAVDAMDVPKDVREAVYHENYQAFIEG